MIRGIAGDDERMLRGIGRAHTFSNLVSRKLTLWMKTCRNLLARYHTGHENTSIPS